MLLKKNNPTNNKENVKLLQRLLHIQDDGVFGVMTEQAVIKFQKENNLTPDGIVGDKTWAVLMSKQQQGQSTLKKSRRSINEIIVHCTATPEGRPVTIQEITQWHIKRGFATIGYHYVVMLDGTVKNGRDVDISGAHCLNHNTNSIGVCYVGGVMKDGKTPKDTRTDAQKKALVDLLKKLRALYPTAKIHGHRDFANKDCPSFDATKEYKNI